MSRPFGDVAPASFRKQMDRTPHPPLLTLLIIQDEETNGDIVAAELME